MANTLNLGNGNWAVKKDSLLAYNSENGNYKPLPFDFTRASSATVVNKDGLIETVGSGEPRIDYKDDVKGALLLEPQRTNLVTYSEDFSDAAWTKDNVTITQNSTVSPNGTLNASLMLSTNSNTRISDAISFSNTFYVSVFVKYIDQQFIQIYSGASGAYYINFDIKNKLYQGGSLVSEVKFEDYGNGWLRLGAKFSGAGAASSTIRLGFSQSLTSTYGNSGGNTSSGSSIYIWGFQLEDNVSYATSYIPTSGSAVTRIADVCNNGGNEQVFNNNTSVWFIDFSRFIYDSSISTKSMVLQDSSGVDQILFWFDHPSDSVRFRDSLNSLTVIGGYISTLANARKKVALKIDGTVLSVFADGVKIGSDYTRPTAFSIGKMDFYGGGTNILDVRFYNTALTDQELQALTQV